ncbi:hypothetical protein OKJ99_18900 [Streptomyces endophyticus]|uniref:Transposase n=1 Tax=Streptomyces endophyticus TaxID=714166 RepID=A0ABU6F6B3_9ACTN|nr:hypothetical protein [Streptomyces endophyticus]MEB8339561.1 hypothetical protein [Streptomyces endophyticus]
MPRPYPPEFRARAIALARAGKQAKQTAVEGELTAHLGHEPGEWAEGGRENCRNDGARRR